MLLVSSQLQSQTFSTRLVVNILMAKGKDVHVNSLHFAPWWIGLWTNYGVISWKEIAKWLLNEALHKMAPNYPDYLYTEVEERGKHLWLVPSSQDGNKKYAVLRTGKSFSCQCFKFKCWNNRLVNECPKLFEALGKTVFCHHTKAVEQFLSNKLKL
jgi:hypothetical protein